MNICIIHRSVLIYLLLCYGKKIVNGDEQIEKNRSLSQPTAKNEPSTQQTPKLNHSRTNQNFNNSNNNRSVNVDYEYYTPGPTSYTGASSHRSYHTPADPLGQHGFQPQYPAGHAHSHAFGPGGSHSRPAIRPVSPHSRDFYYAPEFGHTPAHKAPAYFQADNSYARPAPRGYGAAHPELIGRGGRAAYHQPGLLGYDGHGFGYNFRDPSHNLSAAFSHPGWASQRSNLPDWQFAPTHQQPSSAYQPSAALVVPKFTESEPDEQDSPDFDPQPIDLDVSVKRDTKFYSFFRDLDGTEVFTPTPPYAFNRVFEGEFELWSSRGANFPKEIVFIPNDDGAPTLEVVFSSDSSETEQSSGPKRKPVYRPQQLRPESRASSRRTAESQLPKPIPTSSELIILDIKNKRSTEQVEYRNFSALKIQKFTCKPGFLIESVIKGGRVLHRFKVGSYPNRLLILVEDGKPVLRTLCPNDIDELEPEPVPHPKYYPQPSSLPAPRLASLPKPQPPKPAEAPSKPPKQVKFITIDVNHRESSDNMVLYHSEGANVHVFTAFEPYYIKAVERGSERLWEYQQDKYPIQVIYEEKEGLKPLLELVYSEDEEMPPPPSPEPQPSSPLITVDIKHRKSTDELFYLSYPKLNIQKFVCKPGFLIKSVVKNGHPLFEFHPGFYPNRVMIMFVNHKPILRTLCPTDVDKDEPDPVPDPSHYPQPGAPKPAPAKPAPAKPAPAKYEPQPPKKVPPPTKLLPDKDDSASEKILVDDEPISVIDGSKASDSESDSDSDGEGEIIDLEPGAPKPAVPKLSVITEPKLPVPQVTQEPIPEALSVKETMDEPEPESEGELIPLDDDIDLIPELVKPEAGAELATQEQEEPKPEITIDYKSLSAVDLNISTGEEGHTYALFKRSPLKLFTARTDYGFSSVKLGGSCCKSIKTLWEAKDNTEYAKQVRSFKFYTGPLEVIISLYNGQRYKFLDMDTGWTKFDLSKKTPMTLNIRDTYCNYLFCSHIKDGVRQYLPRDGFLFSKLVSGETGCCRTQKIIWETHKEENLAYKVIRDGTGCSSTKNITLYFMSGKIKHLKKIKNTWVETTPLYELDISKKDDTVHYSYTKQFGFGIYTARDNVHFTTVKLGSASPRVSTATFWSSSKRPYSKRVITNYHFGCQRTKYITIELSNGKSIHFISPMHSKNWRMMQILVDVNIHFKANRYEYRYYYHPQMLSYRTNHNFLFYRVMDKKAQIWRGKEGEYATTVIVRQEKMQGAKPINVAIVLSTGEALYFRKFSKLWCTSNDFPPFELELDNQYSTTFLEFSNVNNISYRAKHNLLIDSVVKTNKPIWKAKGREDLAFNVIITREKLIIQLINFNNLIYDLDQLSMYNFTKYVGRKVVDRQDNAIPINDDDEEDEQSDKEDEQDEEEDEQEDSAAKDKPAPEKQPSEDEDDVDDSVSVLDPAGSSPIKAAASDTTSTFSISESEGEEDFVVTVGGKQPSHTKAEFRAAQNASAQQVINDSAKAARTKHKIDFAHCNDLTSVNVKPVSNPGHKPPCKARKAKS